MDKRKSRRQFIELSLKGSVALSMVPPLLMSCNTDKKEQEKTGDKASDKLDILILGGTSFLGPHQVSSALKRGHRISTFTRGKTKPSVHAALFDQVEQLIGDREDNLTALENRKWDVVIDNSGRNVEWIRKSAELLQANCGIYLYTSSTGVYFPYSENGHRESDTVVLKRPEGVDEFMNPSYDYGIMKANSELAAAAAFGPDRTIVIRPTYMIGPADKTNRFIHWPIRLSKGGEVLVPGKATDKVQYVYVRDVAEWMIRLAEQKKNGVYNAVGPKATQNVHEFVEEAAKAFDTDATFVKIEDYDFLKDNGIEYIVPWIMPLDGNQGSAMISNEKAIKNGLQFRPLHDTVKDTYTWWNSSAVTQEERDEVEQSPKSILAREQAIIKAWRTR